jgi:hypothetical protein
MADAGHAEPPGAYEPIDSGPADADKGRRFIQRVSWPVSLWNFDGVHVIMVP